MGNKQIRHVPVVDDAEQTGWAVNAKGCWLKPSALPINLVLIAPRFIWHKHKLRP